MEFAAEQSNGTSAKTSIEHSKSSYEQLSDDEDPIGGRENLGYDGDVTIGSDVTDDGPGIPGLDNLVGLVKEAQLALNSGTHAELIKGGSSGSYFIRNRDQVSFTIGKRVQLWCLGTR